MRHYEGERMTQQEIEKITKLSGEIENFRDCYADCKLSGDRDGVVAAERLIEFLIEHPEFMKIAESIRQLSR